MIRNQKNGKLKMIKFRNILLNESSTDTFLKEYEAGKLEPMDFALYRGSKTALNSAEKLVPRRDRKLRNTAEFVENYLNYMKKTANWQIPDRRQTIFATDKYDVARSYGNNIYRVFLPKNKYKIYSTKNTDDSYKYIWRIPAKVSNIITFGGEYNIAYQDVEELEILALKNGFVKKPLSSSTKKALKELEGWSRSKLDSNYNNSVAGMKFILSLNDALQESYALFKSIPSFLEHENGVDGNELLTISRGAGWSKYAIESLDFINKFLDEYKNAFNVTKKLTEPTRSTEYAIEAPYYWIVPLALTPRMS